MDKIRDTYQTIATESYGEYREKGSKFLAYAYPVQSIEEVELYLEELRPQHPKSRHHCYAYRLGINGEPHRANDDGEPSGTAGKPIHGQLLSFEVSDCLIVVVRYFGGTKLGASGLINAYRTAAKEALGEAQIKQVILGKQYELIFDYAEMGHVMNVIKSLELHIEEKSFEAQPRVVLKIRNSEIEQSLIQLKAKLLNISTEQIDDKTVVPFCQINEL